MNIMLYSLREDNNKKKETNKSDKIILVVLGFILGWFSSMLFYLLTLPTIL